MEEFNKWFDAFEYKSAHTRKYQNGYHTELVEGHTYAGGSEFANGYGATIEESIRCALISWYESD